MPDDAPTESDSPTDRRRSNVTCDQQAQARLQGIGQTVGPVDLLRFGVDPEQQGFDSSSYWIISALVARRRSFAGRDPLAFRTWSPPRTSSSARRADPDLPVPPRVIAQAFAALG